MEYYVYIKGERVKIRQLKDGTCYLDIYKKPRLDFTSFDEV